MPRERGLPQVGARGCSTVPRTRRLPPVRSLGKVAPGAVPARPRCAASPKRRHDHALQGSYPFAPIPAERSGRLSPPFQTAGEAAENARNPARVGDCPAL